MRWQQSVKERVFSITDNIIASLLVAALSTVGYLVSRAINWVKPPLPQMMLGLGIVMGAVTMSVLIWRVFRPRTTQREPEGGELRVPGSDRISMLQALCRAGFREQRGLQALKSQKWPSAWVSFEQAIREILNHFRTGDSLLDTIEGLKTHGAFLDQEWQKIRDDWDAVLRDVKPQVSAVCAVDLPFGAEIINNLQKVLERMEETYQHAMRLLERRAWWKALLILRKIPGYRDANTQVARLVTGTLATVVVVPLIVIMAAAIILDGESELPPPPKILTFTITCASGPLHTVQAGETITLSAINAVFIEPNFTPQDWATLTGTLLKLPGEEKRFSYAPGGSGPDMLTFTFITNEKTGTVATMALPITIVPERRGLCYP
jgi:hypothetical protein